MKKIILSFAVIAIVGTIAVGATRAYFTSTQTSAGNTFAAGKLDLQLGDSETLPFAVSNVVPGQNATGTVTLTNTAGNIPGKLSIRWTKTADAENDMIAPEIKSYSRPTGCTSPGGTTADYDGNGGELDIFMQFAPFVDVNKDGIFNTGDYQLAYNGQSTLYPGYRSGDLYYSGLNSYAANADGNVWNDIMTLNGGESVNIVIPWQFPTESTDCNYSQNMAMTDGLGFDSEFTLTQVH